MTASDLSDRIDDSFIPIVKPSVASVEVDGERVLYDIDSGRLHQLDVVASVIWPCLDGTASISELSADLANAFGADPGQVNSDVLDLIRLLTQAGLVVEGGRGETPALHTNNKPDDLVSEVPSPSFLVDPPGG